MYINGKKILAAFSIQSTSATLIGGWSGGGIKVPNAGTVETVYFNTYMTTNEVVEILSQLTYDSDGYVSILRDASNTIAMYVVKNEEGYTIQKENIGVTPVTTDIIFSTNPENDFKGWGSFATININGKVTSSEIVNGTAYEVGTQNEAIKNIFSTTPFTFNKDETITLEGNYDGAVMNVEENCTINIKELIEKERKLPLYINIKVGN